MKWNKRLFRCQMISIAGVGGVVGGLAGSLNFPNLLVVGIGLGLVVGGAFRAIARLGAEAAEHT